MGMFIKISVSLSYSLCIIVPIYVLLVNHIISDVTYNCQLNEFLWPYMQLAYCSVQAFGDFVVFDAVVDVKGVHYSM